MAINYRCRTALRFADTAFLHATGDGDSFNRYFESDGALQFWTPRLLFFSYIIDQPCIDKND